MHWDGTRWTETPLPEFNGRLDAVDAVSATEVWAVGSFEWDYSGEPPASASTLVMRWDGTRWSLMPTPRLRGFENSLVAVSASARSNVWVVGSVTSGSVEAGNQVPVTQRWNGRQWRTWRPPGNARSNFTDISALSPSAVWLVGDSSGRDPSQFIHRWDGKRWHAARLETNLGTNEEGNTQNGLSAVHARTRNDVWAVGWNLNRSLIERWNGRRWAIMRAPAEPDLNAVAAVSDTDVWAVGSATNLRGPGNDVRRPYIQHWNGSRWSSVRLPRVAGTLDSVDASSPTSVWAVGRGPNNTSVIASYRCRP
jgi:hypothetical protein